MLRVVSRRSARPAAGGGRWVEVAPDRLQRWLSGFDERHDVLRTDLSAPVLTLHAADGSVAECHPPFPPMDLTGQPGSADGLRAEPLVGHANRSRTVGVLLVRAGGHAVGVFEGDRLTVSKVGSRPVHGRSAAGGWSQHRFARRREGQLREAYGAAAGDAARVLLPHAGRLDAVVGGGDRRAVQALREDARLAPLFALLTERFLTVPDPRLAVLRDTPAAFRAVRIRIVDPQNGPG